MNDAKRSHILDRALEVFWKHGYKRVSMNEIAEAAGVSRPGLYLYFQSKEQVFNEVIGQHGARLIDEISAALGGYETAGDKLLYAFEVWTIRNFDRNIDSPEAKEIVDMTPLFAREAHKSVYKKFDVLLASIISEADSNIEQLKLSPEQVAHILSSAMRGFKLTAGDSSELRDLIKTLISLSLQKPPQGLTDDHQAKP